MKGTDRRTELRLRHRRSLSPIPMVEFEETCDVCDDRNQDVPATGCLVIHSVPMRFGMGNGPYIHYTCDRHVGTHPPRFSGPRTRFDRILTQAEAQAYINALEVMES